LTVALAAEAGEEEPEEPGVVVVDPVDDLADDEHPAAMARGTTRARGTNRFIQGSTFH
jgi:nucleotide-binding universal stress UspA family protein